MAEATRIEKLQAAIATGRTHLIKARRKAEFAALRLSLIGGDEAFGGATIHDPHPSKRKGTGMDRLFQQFYIAEGGTLPELPPSGDPGSVLNRLNMTRYFLQGDAAEIILDPKLAPDEREEKLFPILVRLDALSVKEEELRASLKARSAK